MANRQAMSMEAALDEERLAVLELMEGLNKKKEHRGSNSTIGSNPAAQGSSPTLTNRTPMMSMLDVGDVPSPPRHKSIAGTSAAGISQAPVRSMLDIGPSSQPRAQKVQSARSANTSPTSSNASLVHNRSLSEAASKPPDFGPRGAGKKGDKTDGYQFSGYLQSNPGGPMVPKRNTQAGKLPKSAGSAEHDGNAKDRGRSVGFMGGLAPTKSRSPHNRLGLRSSSPSIPSNMLVTDSGELIDKDTAYRRLSDANLALAGGNFASFANRKMSDSNGKGRLNKDYSFTGDDNVVESSDEPGSSDDEGPRGRRKGSKETAQPSPLGLGRAGGPREAKSLMAAAEEERQMLVEKEKKPYRVKSLLEPEITVTGPSGDRVKSLRQGVHPSNAFDQCGASGFATPHTSDTEQDISDIRRAQKLAILLTPITSAPETQRTVRTIFRGDFAKMQKEAEEDIRRIRKYLVATDLSEEAAHALEWTVGTVLRDGDTLLCVYCVDEDTTITDPVESTPNLERVASSVAGSTSSLPISHPGIRQLSAVHIPSPLSGTPRGSGTPRSQSVAPLTRQGTNREQERVKAVEDITERVSRLLRKTKLQVRVVVEVIHCRSPRHLITEVIDYFGPTMVVLGSRGRSNLKGVILGSFSNYLVTKSSVPVMVARKRLRKHTKYKRSSARLANNLPALDQRTLATAKID